ncbi:MAG: hypothetical protein VB143_06070, partial [Burkholderia sp.]
YPRLASFTPGRSCGLTPTTRGRSPVRELRTPGSVRGVLSNGHFYRDAVFGHHFPGASRLARRGFAADRCKLSGSLASHGKTAKGGDGFVAPRAASQEADAFGIVTRRRENFDERAEPASLDYDIRFSVGPHPREHPAVEHPLAESDPRMDANQHRRASDGSR